MNLTDRLLSIRSRLKELAKLDADCLLICSEEHQYKLKPPLKEKQITAFEAQHEVRLPEDYRQFLLEVGSAGAGPYYGLNPLGHFGHLGAKPSKGFLATPFPLHDWFNTLDNPNNLSEVEIASNHWVSGTICLSDQGCGMFDLLVLSGDERGTIWTDDRTNQFGIFPVAPNREKLGESSEDEQIFTIAENPQRTTFLDWYEWWLDWSFEEIKLFENDSND